VATRFDRLSDILSVRRGDIIRKSDRSELFTGPSVGNTPQKGINWGGLPKKSEDCMSSRTSLGWEV
jgi:hypothetical protein